MTNDELIYINGLDGETGDYLVEPLSYADVANFVKGESHDTPVTRFLKFISAILSRVSLGLPDGVAADDVTQAGWGVVFHVDEDPQVKQALAPLIAHRRQQINDDNIVKELAYDGQADHKDWLAGHGVAAGTVMPTRVPFYLLLVGSPERIPFRFSNLLDVEYAVGRLHFEQPAQYAQYVQSVIAYEKGQAPPRRKEAVFFGTRHKFDKATQLSADRLLDPLADGLPAQNGDPALPGVAGEAGFRTKKLRDDAATKTNLAGIFAPAAGTRPPAFIFSATHGVGFKKPQPSHADQVAKTGALVCQDWPGSGSFEAQHYFAAHDLPGTSAVHGLVTFHFACYGAGTPAHDRFMHKPGEAPNRIAAKSFIAALPQALLSHPQGGALACIGHIERAWSFSFTTKETGPLIQPFYNAIKRILSGKPVGFAVKDFNERYAVLSTEQSQLLEDISFGKQVSDEELATNWAYRNDAEGYTIVGDPAVQIRVDDLV